MSLKADFFRTKVGYLHDFFRSFSWNSSNASPPDNIYITLKYFNKVLTGILKGVPTSVFCSQNSPNNAEKWWKQKQVKTNFPSLPYDGLFDILLLLLHKLSFFKSLNNDLPQTLLDCLSLVVVFTNDIVLKELPATVAGLLMEFDSSLTELQECVIRMLCKTIIPFCFGTLIDKDSNCACYDDIPSIIIIVLNNVSNKSLHFQLVETLMLFKVDIWMDLMSVISYSKGTTKVYATQLLFHYWPNLRPMHSVPHSISNDHLYRNMLCENLSCQSVLKNSAASVMVIDPYFAAKYAEQPSSLYICNSCYQSILPPYYHHLMLPVSHVSYLCENKNCLSKDVVATVILSTGQQHGHTKTLQDGKPACSVRQQILENRFIRYCDECYKNLSKVVTGNLLLQLQPQCNWETENEVSNTILRTIVSLLLDDDMVYSNQLKLMCNNETNNPSTTDENNTYDLYPCDACQQNVGLTSPSENKTFQTLNHFGIWMLSSLCSNENKMNEKIAAHLIAAVMSWYRDNVCLYADDFGSRLEELKCKYLSTWLLKVSSQHYSTFISCLKPSPPKEAFSCGHWTTIRPLWRHYMVSLNLITSLSSYSIISLEMWNSLMPFWMSALTKNLSMTELIYLENEINSIFDTSLSPLPFDSKKIFDFIHKQFTQDIISSQEKGLEWLQILSKVGVVIPLPTLIGMFNEAEIHLATILEKSFKKSQSSSEPLDSNPSVPLKTYCNLESVFKDMNVLCSVDCCTSSNTLSDNVSQPVERKSFRRAGSYRNDKTKLFFKTRASGMPLGEKNSYCICSRSRKTPAKKAAGLQYSWNHAVWYNSRVIACYVDIIDIIYQQIDEQNAMKNSRVYSTTCLNIIKLLNKLVSSLPGTLKTEDVISTEKIEPKTKEKILKAELFWKDMFFNDLLKLVSYILPKDIPDRNEFNRRRMLGHSNSDTQFKADVNEEYFDNNDNFPPPFHLTKILLKILEEKSNNLNDDIKLAIISIISKLCLNGEVMQMISKFQKPVLHFFCHHVLLPSLWKEVKGSNSNTVKMLVEILLKSINKLDGSVETLMEILRDSSKKINSISASNDADNGLTDQIMLIDQTHAFLQFIGFLIPPYEIEVAKVLTYSILTLLMALNHSRNLVFTKAQFVIDSLSVKNLKIIYECMEIAFSVLPKDRKFILSQLLLLHQLRPDSKPINFAFLSRVMDILAIEVVYCKAVGLNFPFSSSACSQNYLLSDEKMLATALLARNEFHKPSFLKDIRQLNHDPTGNSCKPNQVDGKCDIKERSNELVDLGSVDLKTDKENVIKLMSVICKFFVTCNVDTLVPSNKKIFRIFLRQFQSLFEYTEKVSYISCSAKKLRKITGFKTFLNNAPMILDQNKQIGIILLPMLLSMLEVSVLMDSKNSNGVKKYSLNILPSNEMKSWLKILQIIIYKYEVNENDQIMRLIDICVKCLESEFHECGKCKLHTFQFANESKLCDDLCEQNILDATKNEKTADSRIARNSFPMTENSVKILKEDYDLMASSDDVHCKASPKLSYGSNRMENISRISGNNSSMNHFDGEIGGSQSRFNKETKSILEQSKASHADPSKILELLRKTIDKQHTEFKDEFLPIMNRCGNCGEYITENNSDVLCLCILNLCQFVHYHLSLAVPKLPSILSLLANILEPVYKDKMFISDYRYHHYHSNPVILMAKQSIICILHMLTENKIFIQLFLMEFEPGDNFLHILMCSLKGYQKLHCVDVVQYILEGLPDDLTTLSEQKLECLFKNFATYLKLITTEPSSQQWQNILISFTQFFYQVHHFITKNGLNQLDNMFDIMDCLLNTPTYLVAKQTLLESFSKILSVSILTGNFSVQKLYSLCSTNNTIFNKDKDKVILTRCVVSKLMSSLKLNYVVSDQNLLLLLQFILVDSGSTLNKNTLESIDKKYVATFKIKMSCYAMEYIRSNLQECLEFLNDTEFFAQNDSDSSHLSTSLMSQKSLQRDCHRANVKLAVAQVVAGQLDHKNLPAYFPWIFDPLLTMHLGPKEYTDCVMHIKKLSWVLLGALNHLATQKKKSVVVWQPLPLDIGPCLAKNLQVILTGYLDRHKIKEPRMMPLFHAFLFCQLWTIYCEQLSLHMPWSNGSTLQSTTSNVSNANPVGEYLMEFWSRVTPSMLVLLEHDGMVSLNIHRHIASLVLCLQQYESSILFKLHSMWAPMLDLQKDGDPIHLNLRKKFYVTKSDSACKNGPFLQLGNIVESIKSRLVKIEAGDLVCII